MWQAKIVIYILRMEKRPTLKKEPIINESQESEELFQSYKIAGIK